MAKADGIWLQFDTGRFGHITIAAEKATAQADREDRAVLLVFNDKHILVEPGTKPAVVVREYSGK